MMYYELTQPQQWRAGYSFHKGERVAFFFNCADCEAPDAVIKGFLGDGPEFNAIGVISKPNGRHPELKDHHLAMFCGPCFDKRVAAAAPVWEERY